MRAEREAEARHAAALEAEANAARQESSALASALSRRAAGQAPRSPSYALCLASDALISNLPHVPKALARVADRRLLVSGRRRGPRRRRRARSRTSRWPGLRCRSGATGPARAYSRPWRGRAGTAEASGLSCLVRALASPEAHINSPAPCQRRPFDEMSARLLLNRRLGRRCGEQRRESPADRGGPCWVGGRRGKLGPARNHGRPLPSQARELRLVPRHLASGRRGRSRGARRSGRRHGGGGASGRCR